MISYSADKVAFNTTSIFESNNFHISTDKPKGEIMSLLKTFLLNYNLFFHEITINITGH